MSGRVFKATLEYDGTDFCGFQWQHGMRTVQGCLEEALERRTESKVRIVGAGRTDAGVHAIGQVVSFTAETRIPVDRMAVALNTALPQDISVRSVREAGSDFSARFSASSREYGYLILNRPVRSAIWRRYAALCRDRLDVPAMSAAAEILCGEQDFASFANQLQPDEPTYRNVMRCKVVARGSFVLVRIEANAFLRGMVRTVVGTLMQIGSGERSPEFVSHLLAGPDRRLAGPSAPPQGLCLLRVRYGDRVDYRNLRQSGDDALRSETPHNHRPDVISD